VYVSKRGWAFNKMAESHPSFSYYSAAGNKLANEQTTGCDPNLDKFRDWLKIHAPSQCSARAEGTQWTIFTEQKNKDLLCCPTRGDLS
jgi:hypothetical protein